MVMRSPPCRPLPAVLLIVLLAAGCAQVPRVAVPPRVSSARLMDVDGSGVEYTVVDPQVVPKLRDIARARCDDAAHEPPLNMLALSGGGMYGAFDVGVLHGWSASAKRPTF